MIVDLAFRIEHETENIGPYRAISEEHQQFSDELSEAHDEDINGHPCPQDDLGIERDQKRNEVCAFKSWEQLTTWFTGEELDFCQENGFIIKPVRGKITAIGKCQILIIPEELLTEEVVIL